MDFRRLHHFIGIAELGSMSKAAKRLNIVQPALSHSIKSLELELGTKLFTRSKKGMALTDAGDMFLKSSYGILNQYNRVKENISAIGENPKGLVSVAMTASALNVLTVPLMKLVQAHFPDIELSLEEGLAANIQQGFESGWYDLVVSHNIKAHENQKIEHLIEEELFLTSAFDPQSSKSDIRFQEIGSYALILPKDLHGIAKEIAATAKRLGFSLKTSQAKASMHPTLHLIETGFGHSLLPWAAIYDRIEKKQLVARRVIEPEIRHRISMIYPTHRPVSQATQAVMALLKQSIVLVHGEGKWVGRVLFSD